MKASSPLQERKSNTRALNIVAAAGVVLVLATAATAITFAGSNSLQDKTVLPEASR